MRPGIRIQLLLALGSLLVLAFVPLFFAVASLTSASAVSMRTSSARALGRAIAAHVSAALGSRPGGDASALLDAQVGDGVAAVGVYDAEGKLVARADDEGTAAELPPNVDPTLERVAQVPGPRGGAVLVVVPHQRGGAVGVVMRVGDEGAMGSALVRLVGLYTGIVALALLVFAYFVMTRLVVQPLEQLSAAARRVADGGRKLEVPGTGARELSDLGQSLAQMTARLRDDEAALRAKVDELERATAELKAAQETLVRSERLASVGRLAAGLAHEIGNPIAAILGFQDLLLDGTLDAGEQRDFLERMKKETVRIHRVLRDLLDFARPAVRNKEGEAPDPGSVAEAIDDVLSLVKPQKAFKDVDVAADVAPGLPAVTLTHERIVQVVLNLLLNAADAVPRAGGRIVVRAQRASGGRVRIEVEDNGPGVAPEIADDLFEPFVTTKEVGSGTGLGLAVCRGLVEAAGGVISVERGGDGGARFVMELPEQRDA